jgi:hypothetical protein
VRRAPPLRLRRVWASTLDVPTPLLAWSWQPSTPVDRAMTVDDLGAGLRAGDT